MSRVSKQTLCLASAIALAACSDSNNSPSEIVDANYLAVITGTVFGASEISLANTVVADDEDTVDVDESLTSYDIVNGYAEQDLSDVRTLTYGKHFYRLGRTSQDNITKFSFAEPNVPEWQYSVNSGDETGANPHDLVFVSEEKAYVIRYGLPSILIINPSVGADDEESFQIGTIDLSTYDLDGVPEMTRAVIHDDILYIVTQGLDAANGYTPGQAYLIAIDTNTDEEIQIGDGELEGLALEVKNPIDLDLFGDDLYVSAIGRYGASWTTPPRPPEYTGGIEKISLNNYSSELLVDDGDADVHPYGQFNGLAIVSDQLAYFRGYNAWQDSSLYQFNLSTGEVIETPLEGIANVDIRAVELSPQDELWVGIGHDDTPEIKVLSTADNTEITTISTVKTPSVIQFSSNLAVD